MTVISRQEYLEQAKANKPRKYRNEPTIIDGIKFASKREGAYYAELKIREKAGEVAEVELQKRFIFSLKGQLIGTYKSDFAFFDNVRRCYRVVDVKGVITKEFQRTRRMMRAFHGVEVEVVR